MLRPIPNLGINLCDTQEISKVLRPLHNDKTGLRAGFCVCGASGNGQMTHVCQTIDLLLHYTKQLDHLIQDYKKGDLDSILKSLDFLSQNQNKEV